MLVHFSHCDAVLLIPFCWVLSGAFTLLSQHLYGWIFSEKLIPTLKQFTTGQEHSKYQACQAYCQCNQLRAKMYSYRPDRNLAGKALGCLGSTIGELLTASVTGHANHSAQQAGIDQSLLPHAKLEDGL